MFEILLVAALPFLAAPAAPPLPLPFPPDGDPAPGLELAVPILKDVAVTAILSAAFGSIVYYEATGDAN